MRECSETDAGVAVVGIRGVAGSGVGCGVRRPVRWRRRPSPLRCAGRDAGQCPVVPRAAVAGDRGRRLDGVRSESQPVRQNRASPRHHRVLRRGRTATQAPEIDLTPPPDHATASRSKGIDKVRAGTVRAPLARAQRRWRCATAPGCLAWIESAGLPGVRSGRLASIRECATGLVDAPDSVARASLHAALTAGSRNPIKYDSGVGPGR